MKKVICGPFDSALREVWTAEVAGAIRDGRGESCLYLVPTRGLAGAVRQQILTGLPGTAGEQVLTLYEVVEAVLARSGRSGARTVARIDALTAERLTARVMRGMDGTYQGTPWETWSHSPGVVAAFRQHIGELKRARIEPERLQEIAGSRARAGARDAADVQALADVYAAYQAELRAGEAVLLDTEETYLEAARWLLKHGLQAAFPGVTRVYVDSFTDFEPHQWSVLEQVLSAEQVLVYLPYQKERWAWLEGAAAQMERMIGQFAERGFAVEESADGAGAGSSAGSDGALDVASGSALGAVPEDLLAFRERLFAPHAEPVADAPNVEVFAARTVEKEWLWVAKRIKQLCADGVSPHEIAILTSQEWRVGGTGQRVLAAEGIPVERAATMRASDVPWVRDLLALCAVADEDWHREALQRAAGALWWWEHPLRGRETQVMAAARGLGVVKGLEKWRSRLAKALVSADGEAAEIWQAVAGWLEFVAEKLAALPVAATGSEMADALRGWIPEAKMHAAWTERYRTGQLSGADLQRDLQAREALVAVLDGVMKTEALLGAETMTRGECVGWIRRQLEAAEVRPERGRRGGVTVLEPSVARGLSFRYVFFVGLNEGAWPVPPSTPWLLREGLREELAAEMPLLSPNVQGDQQKLFFLMGWQTAREGAFLSYVGGSKRDLPSRYVEEVCGLCPALKERDEDAYLSGSALYPAEQGRISNRREVRDWLVARAATSGEVPPEAVTAAGGAARWWQVLRQAQGELERAAQPGMTPFDGALQDPEAQRELAAAFSEERVYSVSLFNRYGACPYQFFLSRVLRLEEEQEEEEELSALEKGNLYHAVLHELYRPLTCVERITSDAVERLRGELPLVFERQWRKAQSGRQKAVGKRQELAKERMLRRLQEYVESEIEAWETLGLPLVPRYLEWVFGMEFGPEQDPRSQTEPVTVAGLKFRGQIDRIDVAGTDSGARAFYLVDYKTKGTKAMPKAIEQGLDFQLPVYLKAVEQALFGEGSAVGGAYVSIEKADRTTGALVKAEHLQDLGMGKKRLKLGSEEWDALLAGSEATLRRYRERMADGQFPVEPGDEKVCDYCEYRQACRYDRLRAMKRNGRGAVSDGE